MLLLYILLLLLQVLIGLFVFFLVITFLTGAPFVPSSNAAAEAMARLARLKKGTRVYDLGCGDGRLLFLAAKAGAIATGCDINPYLTFFVNLKARVLDLSHAVRAEWRDLWKADISGADVVFVYLLPWRMEQLARKLEKELKPEVLVVSNSFIFPGWKKVGEDQEHHVYSFQTPTEPKVAKRKK